MDYFELRSISEAGSRPTIRTTEKSVLITIPLHLAESAGLLECAKLEVQFGESGKQRGLRLSKGGRWAITRRRNVLQLFVREIFPKAPAPLTNLDFQVGDQRLDLMLPTPLDLADPHVVVRR
ncbi:MAG TPA: hypothetical protein VD906_10400 [Caulobacteraceae bacterium]|nr:hypothetical protein [Caulobacteraceae bacterium]